MPKVKIHSWSGFLRYQFKKPILDWRGVPELFMETVYLALNDLLAVAATGFSTRVRSSPSESTAVFKIPGGESSIRLQNDGLSVELVNGVPSDRQLAEQIITRVDSGFRELVQRQSLATISFRGYRHLEFPAQSSVDEYLAALGSPVRLKSDSLQIGSIEPGIKFRATGKQSLWAVDCQVERSYAVTGVFVNIDARILQPETYRSLESRMGIIGEIVDSCDKSLDLAVHRPEDHD